MQELLLDDDMTLEKLKLLARCLQVPYLPGTCMDK